MGHCLSRVRNWSVREHPLPDPPVCPLHTSLLSSVTSLIQGPAARFPVPAGFWGQAQQASSRFLLVFYHPFPPNRIWWSWGQEWLVNTLRHGSSLGTRDPFKSPEGSTSLCSPKQFPRGLKFSFKSPFPVLLTSLWGRKVAPAGSSSWGSRRPGLAWASTAGNLPRGQATISCWEGPQASALLPRRRKLQASVVSRAASRSFSAPSAGPARAALHLTPSRGLRRISPLISKTISLHSVPPWLSSCREESFPQEVTLDLNLETWSQARVRAQHSQKSRGQE